MKFKVTLFPNAYLDIKEIIDWYNSKQPGLEKSFYISLNAKIRSISLAPFSFQLSYKESRSAMLDSFPFQIHFRVNEFERVVLIYSVTHTSRNPRIWKEKN